MDTTQVGQIFGVGDGTVFLYIHQVCTVLMHHWKDVVSWPTEEERNKMKLRLRARPSWAIWEDCIGILDGTLIPFTGKPGIPKDQAADYFNYRKQMYGMQATIVCDDQNRITHFSCLYPGNVHDSRTFKASSIGNNPEAYYNNRHQYILADTTYGINNCIISPFKKRKRSHYNLSKEKRHFNRNLSHLRVKIEHIIGILKYYF